MHFPHLAGESAAVSVPVYMRVYACACVSVCSWGGQGVKG